MVISGPYLQNKKLKFYKPSQLEAQYKWLQEEKVDYIVWSNELTMSQPLTLIRSPRYKKKFILIKEFGRGNERDYAAVYKIIKGK